MHIVLAAPPLSPLVESTVLRTVARARRYTGSFHAAISFGRAALEFAQRSGDDWEVARASHDLGRCYQDAYDNRRAADLLNEARARFERLSKPAPLALVLKDEGRLLQDASQHEDAEQKLREAVELAQWTKEATPLSSTLHSLGRFLHEARSAPLEAKPLFEEALDIRREMHDRRGEAATLNHLGGVYDDIDEHGLAVQMFSDALKLRRAMRDIRGQGASTYNIACHYAEAWLRSTAKGPSRRGDSDVLLSAVWCYDIAIRLHRTARNERGALQATCARSELISQALATGTLDEGEFEKRSKG